MRRFRQWLVKRFLPAWAKDSVVQENQAMRLQLDEQAQKIRELNAYIDGLETGMRAMRRIVIQNGVMQ